MLTEEELHRLWHNRLGMAGVRIVEAPTPAATGADGKVLKYNEGKVRLSLVDPFFIRELARVFEYGLSKYEEGSWREFTFEDAKALIDPAMRHTDQYRDGEYYDQESGLPHLMSAAWNLMMIHYHTMRRSVNHGELLPRMQEDRGVNLRP